MYKKADNNYDPSGVGYHQLDNDYGWYIEKVPQEILSRLGTQVDKIKNNFDNVIKINNKLIGEIEHEYNIEGDNVVYDYIRAMVNEFNVHCRYFKERHVELEKNPELWVNFQRKYEYNPLHQHYGIFSFVIWYQIPYTFKEEQKYGYKDKPSLHGDFSFFKPCIVGNKTDIDAINLNVDKSKEGYMVVFPASLHHGVYPFYSSDDYRISIAGNIKGYACNNILDSIVY